MQADIINKLLKRSEQVGFPVSDDELMQMQMPQQVPTQLDGIEEESNNDEENNEENNE